MNTKTPKATDKKKSKKGEQLVCQNRKAKFDYHLEAHYEAGLVLTGTEVKSLRQGRGNIGDSYATVDRGQAFLYHFHIPEYSFGNRFNHEVLRKKKLLLHKREIDKLTTLLKQKGYTLVPTKVYFKNGYAKIDLALGRGKTKGDKRQTIKEREDRRDMDKAIKSSRRKD